MYLLSLVWDSLLPVRSLKVTLYHVILFLFLFTSLTIPRILVDDGRACGGTEIHINVLIIITCSCSIIKTEMKIWWYFCQERKCYSLHMKAGVSVNPAKDQLLQSQWSTKTQKHLHSLMTLMEVLRFPSQIYTTNIMRWREWIGTLRVWRGFYHYFSCSTIFVHLERSDVADRKTHLKRLYFT